MHGSALRPRPISAPTSSDRTWGATFACALVTTILFYLPDAYLYWSRGLGQSLTLLKLLPLMVLLGLFLTLVASRFWRILGIAFALIIQLIWVGMFSYAGIAPAPSAILLGQLQLYEVHQAGL